MIFCTLLHFRKCHSYQGREANFENKKKVKFPIGKWTFFGPEPTKRALHSLGLIGPPLGGAIRPSKLSSFWSKILRWYRKSILPNQKYIKYCLPITDYLLATTSPNHIITHYLLSTTYYLLTTIYRRRRDFVCSHPISSSSSSSGFTATVKTNHPTLAQ